MDNSAESFTHSRNLSDGNDDEGGKRCLSTATPTRSLVSSWRANGRVRVHPRQRTATGPNRFKALMSSRTGSDNQALRWVNLRAFACVALFTVVSAACGDEHEITSPVIESMPTEAAEPAESPTSSSRTAVTLAATAAAPKEAVASVPPDTSQLLSEDYYEMRICFRLMARLMEAHGGANSTLAVMQDPNDGIGDHAPILWRTLNQSASDRETTRRELNERCSEQWDMSIINNLHQELMNRIATYRAECVEESWQPEACWEE